MRHHSCICFVSLLALLALGGCNSQQAEGAASAPPATAAVQARAALVTPTLGGTVLAVGEQQLELAVLENGSVLGQVYDASGALVSEAERPKLSAELRTQGGGHPRAELSWQPAQGCWLGRAQLEAGLVAEPLQVSLEAKGQVNTATLGEYAILPLARFGGSVLAVGPHAVELVAEGNALLAHVLEASGQARAGAELSLQLELAGGAPVALVWDAQRARYRAELAGKLELAAQPLRLTLTAAGKSYVGAVASLRAAAQAQLAARAQLAAAASARLAAPVLDATAQAALPGAALKAKASATSKLAGKATSKVTASKAAAAQVNVKAPALKVDKSVSTSASAKKPSAKASAGIKAGASLSFGK